MSRKLFILLFFIMTITLCGNLFTNTMDEMRYKLYDLNVIGPRTNQWESPQVKDLTGNQKCTLYRYFYDIIGFHLEIENPHSQAQEITLQYFHTYKLGVFQPGEKRVYSENSLPQLQKAMGFKASNMQLHFENGTKSRIKILEQTIPNALEIYDSEKKNITAAEHSAREKKFDLYTRRILSKKDKDQCLKEGFDRYSKNYSQKKQQKFKTLDDMKTYLRHAGIPIQRFIVRQPQSQIQKLSTFLPDITRINIYLPEKTKFHICEHCNQKTISSSLYCVHCGKIQYSLLNLPKEDVYLCPYCGRSVRQNETLCPTCSHEVRKFKNDKLRVYDHTRNLIGIPVKKDPYDTSNFDISQYADPYLLDMRAAYISFNREKANFSIQRISERELDENMQLTNYLPALFCDMKVWNNLPYRKKEYLKNRCFKGSVLIIYNADRDASQLTGFGSIHYVKGDYTDSPYSFEHLYDKTSKFKFINYSTDLLITKTLLMNSNINPTQPFQMEKEKKRFKKKSRLPLIILILLPPFYLYFLKRKRNRFLLSLTGTTIICIVGIITLFYITFSTEGIEQFEEISLHDQKAKRIWTNSSYYYFKPNQRKESIPLQTNIRHDILQDPFRSKHPQYYRPAAIPYFFEIKDNQTVFKSDNYKKGHRLHIEREVLEQTKEKLIIESGSSQIFNGYEYNLKESIFKEGNRYFKGTDILAGQKGKITQINQTEFISHKNYSQMSKFIQGIDYLDYLSNNDIPYAISRYEKKTDSLWSNRITKRRTQECFRVTLFPPIQRKQSHKEVQL